MKSLRGCMLALLISMGWQIGGVMAEGAAGKAEKTPLTAAQQETVTKLQAKGALVLPVAADSDALVISLQGAGKAAGDEELALIKDLPKVDQIDLRGTSITDAGLANLANFTTLTQLHLEKTAVTDAGLSHLKGLTHLVYLNLYGTAVTDKGIAELSGLKGLKRLYLWQTKVTDAGVTPLKAAIPGLYVNRGEELTVTTQPVEVKPAAKVAAKPTAPGEAVAAAIVTPGAKAINSKCPVSGKDVDPAHVVTFEGKAIGLCCEKCEAKFLKNPAKCMTKVVADVK